jgi:hypothetical protein
LRLSGPDAEEAVIGIDLSEYNTALTELLEQGYRRAQQAGAIAIYFEYDIDNNWDSWLFLHDQYQPEREQDDEWTCDWVDELRGPSLPAFTQVYNRYGGFHVERDSEIETTLYLCARNVAAFGSGVVALLPPSFAICMGYHDQGIVTRIKEIGA